MGVISYVKEEIAVIRERDPAIKSNMEVFLYPTFHAILKYRFAHKLYQRKHISGPDGFHSGPPERPGNRDSPGATMRERDFSLTMELAWSSVRPQFWAIMSLCIRV